MNKTYSCSNILPIKASVNTLTILLVEDDPVSQMVAKGFLVKLGYSVDLAADGHEALQLLTENDYSLVLMDCQMQEMDGFRVTAIIRDPESSVRNHSIPVIGLTTNALHDDRAKCQEAGMDDCLTKPLFVDSLAVVVAKCLTASTENRFQAFDEEALLTRNEGDDAVVKEAVLMFTVKVPQYIATLRENLAERNCAKVRQQAHKLKGAAVAMSAYRLAALAAELEEIVDTNELDKADLITQKLILYSGPQISDNSLRW